MDLNELRTRFNAITEEISRALSKPKASLGDYAASFAFAREVEKTFDTKDSSSITSVVKAKLIEVIKAQGNKLPEKASTALNAGGWAFSMYPTRTGTDPKKMMARLIVKAQDMKDKMALVKKYMKMVPTYELDQALLNKAVKDKIITLTEISECKYDESWTLKTPTQLEE